MDHYTKLKFPSGFLWGAATSAHQVEGNNTNCDWYAWEQLHQPKDKQSGLACDQYHRFQQDFDLAKQLHHNAHRLSIEWARIENREGTFNQKEIEHYRQVLQALKDRGLTTIVTLHHFTSPLWLVRTYGGWPNRKTATLFARYAQKIAQELDSLIDYYVTINEPLIYASQTYLLEEWPAPYRTRASDQVISYPYSKRAWKTYQTIRTMIKAHRLAYRAIKTISNKPVGIVKNCAAIEPFDFRLLRDVVAASIISFVQNDYFLNAVRRTTDFIGLNHYFHEAISISRQMITGVLKHGINKLLSKNGVGDNRTDLGWSISPSGIYQTINLLKKYHKPIIITENGLADANDEKRAKYIREYLKWIHKAITEGADIRGYLHWSLIDNFEWAFGFWPRFGLIKVDYRTQKREIRPSAWEYAKICRENSLEIKENNNA